MMRKKAKTFTIFLGMLFSIMLSLNVVTCNAEEPSVDVKFQILNGGGEQDLYSGDWFSYNITLTNSCVSEINATYTVTVYDPAHNILGNSRDYHFDLQPNQTVVLYPNYTLNGKDGRDAYFADVSGTYILNLTCTTYLLFYRYYESGDLTWEPNHSHISIDVMPSYQKKLNEQTTEYYNQNQQYVQHYEEAVKQSEKDAANVLTLTVLSALIATLSLYTSILALRGRNAPNNKKIYVLYGVWLAVFVYVIINLLIS
jgi:hypothetical protein